MFTCNPDTGGTQSRRMLTPLAAQWYPPGGWATLAREGHLGGGPFDFWKGPGLELTSSPNVTREFFSSAVAVRSF